MTSHSPSAKRPPLTILVTGGSGQVGFELQRQLALFGSILAPGRHALDLSDARAVDDYLANHRPDLILNAAAYTAVDKAEEEPGLARRLNAELPAQLASYAAKRGVTLVHYSSDYVYAGVGTAPWKESDTTGPLGIYGQTKLEGDQAIQVSGCTHLIFRTSWVYAARGHNFMKTMLRLGRERDALRIVNDQIGAPTPARLIAQVTALALYKGITPRILQARNSPLPHMPMGLYHLAPRGETSWHGFASEIFRQASEQGEALAIVPERVAPISSAEYPTPAARPLNSRLAVDKLENALGITLPTWQQQLTLTLSEVSGVKSEEPDASRKRATGSDS